MEKEASPACWGQRSPRAGTPALGEGDPSPLTAVGKDPSAGERAMSIYFIQVFHFTEHPDPLRTGSVEQKGLCLAWLVLFSSRSTHHLVFSQIKGVHKRFSDETYQKTSCPYQVTGKPPPGRSSSLHVPGPPPSPCGLQLQPAKAPGDVERHVQGSDNVGRISPSKTNFFLFQMLNFSATEQEVFTASTEQPKSLSE